MKTHPIIMSEPMVRALLEGRKTQTRRIIKPQPYKVDAGFAFKPPVNDAIGCKFEPIACLYGKAGDLLWVRESCRVTPQGKGYMYKASYSEFEQLLWRSPIYMLRGASRITLEITDVRVERLNDISQADCVEEGINYVCPNCGYTHRDASFNLDHNLCGKPMPNAKIIYRELWESLHGKGSWGLNPWVWGLTFSVHKCNIDDFLKARAV